MKRWYLRALEEEKATRVGFGLHMSEWTSLLSIKSTVEADFPHLATAEACYHKDSTDILSDVESFSSGYCSHQSFAYNY